MFKKAERTQQKLKIAVIGPSGSGKTLSSILMALGIGKKIAVADTENGSASLYADRYNFDVAEIKPPYTTEKYLKVINESIVEGYDVLVMDSISHVWASQGGLLDQKQQLDERGKGNGYTNWASITKKHEQFIAALLHADIHIICTMRSKQDYILQDVNGKSVPKKVGMAPVQRDGMEYEFTTVFDIAMNHEAEVSKDRSGLWEDKFFIITEETGKTFMKWLGQAKVNYKVELGKELKKYQWTKEMSQEYIEAAFNKQHSSQLVDEEIKAFYETLQQHSGDFPNCMDDAKKGDDKPPDPVPPELKPEPPFDPPTQQELANEAKQPENSTTGDSNGNRDVRKKAPRRKKGDSKLSQMQREVSKRRASEQTVPNLPAEQSNATN